MNILANKLTKKHFFNELLSSGMKCSSHLARVIFGKNIDAPKTHRVTIPET